MVEGLPSATTAALPRKLSRLTPSSSTNLLSFFLLRSLIGCPPMAFQGGFARVIMYFSLATHPFRGAHSTLEYSSPLTTLSFRKFSTRTS